LLRLGIRDTYTSIVGDQAYLRAATGIDRDTIVKKVLGFVGGRPDP
jgi:hypothetical protein